MVDTVQQSETYSFDERGLGFFVVFNDISTFLGYLMSKPSL